jgi:hypothetical protein
MYTRHLHAQLVKAIERGATYEVACRAYRISDDTLRQWRAWGEAGEEPFKTLAEDLQVARARGELACLERINQAGRRGEWRADVWRLANDPENRRRAPRGPEVTPEELAQALLRAQRAVEESVPMEPPELKPEPPP